MTEKLYYQNPYQTRATAIVNNIIKSKEGYWVTLDKTIFYPEGGGQPFDLGTVNGIELKKVVEKDGDVWHLLADYITGDEVECQLNWPRRFDHMQQHGGQHIISGVADKTFQAATVGFHLSEHYTTVDLAVPQLSSLQIEQLETEVNSIVFANKNIHSYFADAHQLINLPLRKKPSVDQNIRIVEIDKYDYSPCCGTHPQRTGEIGLIKVLKTEKIRGNTRLYIVCGYRSLNKFTQDHYLINSLIDLTSANESRLLEAIKRTYHNEKLKHKEINNLTEQLLNYKALELIRLKKDNRVINYIDDNLTGNDIKKLLSLIVKHSPETIVLLAGLKDSPKLAVYNSSDPDLHIGDIFRNIVSRYGGKGGGNKISAQGSCSNVKDTTKIFNDLSQIFIK